MNRLGVLRRTELPRLVPWRGFRLLRACLPLAASVMEFCWVYPWVLLLTGVFYGRAPTPLLPAGSALALLLLGHLSVEVAARIPQPLRRGRAGVVALGLVSGALAVKHTYYPGFAIWQLGWVWALAQAAHDALPNVAPPVTAALTATILWWRGVVLGQREFTHAEVELAFRRGVGWSVAFVLLFALYGDSIGFSLTGPAISYTLGFLSLGLIVLAVARLVGIWEESHADEEQALAMNRHWLLLLVILVGTMLLAGTLLSSLVSVDVWTHVYALLRPLAPVVEFLFLILFAVAAVIARAILYVLERVRMVRQPMRPPIVAPDPFGDFLRRLQQIDLPAQVTTSARWGMVIGVVVILSLLVALAVIRARRRARRGDEDERESVWSMRVALGGLGAAWRSLWKRRALERGEHEAAGVSAIRELYRQLLRLGAEVGLPRFRYQTPYEYLPRLRARVPARDRELGTMTEAYVRVRYTPHLPDREEIAEVRVAFETIQRDLEGSEG